MKNLKITKELTGYFDVRKYIANRTKKECPILPEGSNITFTFTNDAVDEEFKEFARPYTNKNGEQRYAVTFKIGRLCHWYDDRSEEVDRPRNVDLDGVEFKVRFAFVTLHGDPSKKEANGYWCNDVQFEKVETNPFKNLSMKDAIQVRSENVQPEDVSETDFLNEVNETNEDGNTGLPY